MLMKRKYRDERVRQKNQVMADQRTAALLEVIAHAQAERDKKAARKAKAEAWPAVEPPVVSPEEVKNEGV